MYAGEVSRSAAVLRMNHYTVAVCSSPRRPLLHFSFPHLQLQLLPAIKHDSRPALGPLYRLFQRDPVMRLPCKSIQVKVYETGDLLILQFVTAQWMKSITLSPLNVLEHKSKLCMWLPPNLCVCAACDAVRQIGVCLTMGGQAGCWADGLPSFLRPDNHSRPLSAILGYKLFPPVCMCRERPGWGGHGYVRVEVRL